MFEVCTTSEMRTRRRIRKCFVSMKIATSMESVFLCNQSVSRLFVMLCHRQCPRSTQYQSHRGNMLHLNIGRAKQALLNGDSGGWLRIDPEINMDEPMLLLTGDTYHCRRNG